MTSEPIPPMETTSDERSLACLAHVLQIVGWFIAPLIILAIRRESRFVVFHALQALLLQVCMIVIWAMAMMAWFALIFGTIVTSAASHSQPPVAIFLMFPLLWLMIVCFWALLLLTAIVYGMKASRGEWAQYPLIGRWARRILHL